jgi:hypothetical protein
VDPRHDAVDDGLVVRWKGLDGHNVHGYRRLAEWFNKRLMRTAYDAHGRTVLGNRIEADYEALTGDDETLRREIRMDIESDGIDASELTDSFVSYGTVRTHLTECLGAEKQESQDESDWEERAITKTKTVATEKAEEALSSLASKEEVDGLGSASVEVDVTLHCGHCATSVPYEIALRRGYVCETHRNEGTVTGGVDP